MNHYDLAQQTAIITGGAQGIGRAVAQRMIASGARVCLWDKNIALAEETAKDLGENAFAMTADVTDAADIQRAAQQVMKTHGRIDILVACAGIAGPNHPIVDFPADTWQQVMEINLTGVFNCCKSILPFMQKGGYGRVVNIASIAGKEGNANAGPYAASKAGVIALTKSLGKEHALENISVNCVTPSIARTHILDGLDPEFIEQMITKVPRGRFLELDEAASMITWLCTRENSFTTGAAFDLSGGRATY